VDVDPLVGIQVLALLDPPWRRRHLDPQHRLAAVLDPLGDGILVALRLVARRVVKAVIVVVFGGRETTGEEQQQDGGQQDESHGMGLHRR